MNHRKTYMTEKLKRQRFESNIIQDEIVENKMSSIGSYDRRARIYLYI